MKCKHRTALVLFAALVPVLLVTIPAGLRAATITVTNTANTGAGTLRAALASAGNGDTIKFSLTLPATIMSGAGLSVVKNVSVIGPGAAVLAINGSGSGTAFFIAPSNTVTLAGLAITNCNSDFGGGVWNQGATLIISNCTVSGNAASFGAGIWNDGRGGSAKLTILNSTISGNSAGFGGGILNDGRLGSASVTISRSSLTGNSAGEGGGIWNDGQFGSASVAILNSTLGGNSASFGGGIWNDGQSGSANLQILNSTLVSNSASWGFGGGGGGIYNDARSEGSATLQIGSAILDSSGVPGGGIANDSATVISLGYNLTTDDSGGYLTNATDQINTDPMLGPLQDNGGPTFTSVPFPGSPAIGKGTNCSGLAVDQPGSQRTFQIAGYPSATGGDGTDIGAVESQDSGLRLVNVSLGSNQFGFNLTGPFTNVVVEASSAYTNWMPLVTNALGVGALRFAEPATPAYSQRFYRARLP